METRAAVFTGNDFAADANQLLLRDIKVHLFFFSLWRLIDVFAHSNSYLQVCVSSPQTLH